MHPKYASGAFAYNWCVVHLVLGLEKIIWKCAYKVRDTAALTIDLITA